MLKISIIEFEKKSVFFINSFLIIIMILFLLLNINIKYFFYFDIILTLFLSYFFFKKSKKLAKYLILTNIFIFFYFLYPIISEFLYLIFLEESYLFILFYNFCLAFIFLVFSSFHKSFIKNLKSFNFKIFLVTIILGIFLGFCFYFVKEPVPNNILFDINQSNYLLKTIFFTLSLSLSEQMIFSGFLFNVYSNLTNKVESFYQVSTIFVLFHLLRFENLVLSYFYNFNLNYLYLMFLYYIFLFIFMLICLYFFSFSFKKNKGNFLYPVIIHFFTDFTLILLINLFGV